jgi:glycosyltransferase involved in cell wall biosynthesis
MSTTEVLHVIARMNVGGTARYIGHLVEDIPHSKLVTGFVQDSEIEDASMHRISAIRISNLGRKISLMNDFRAWKELSDVVRELEPKILHTHTFKAGLLGRLIPGKHVRIHTFHGHLFEDKTFSYVEKKIIAVIERFLARRTDLLISVGEKVGEELRATGIGKHQSWKSIPPGVIPLQTYDKTDARRTLDLEGSELFVGWMARMTSVKNPQLLLDVADQLPEVSFVMAGGGDLLESIRERAPKNVTVIGWADAANFWSAVDLGISTSDNEGMPIALIEAQMAGIPVVATDVGSSSEIIDNLHTGIISTKEVSDLVLAIKKIIGDENLLRTMGESALTHSRNKFKISQMLQLHRDAYSQIRKKN